MSAQIPVPIPPAMRGGKKVLPSSTYLNDIRSSLQRLAARPRAGRGPAIGDTVPPFSVSLRHDAALAVYYVTVSPGYVYERDLVMGLAEDCLFYFEPINLWDGDHPREFEIAEDEAVYIYVPENAAGAVVGADVEIQILGDTQESTNFIPGAQEGEYWYKLAALKADGGVLVLQYFLAGSHIAHVSALTADYVIRGCPEGTEMEGAQIGRLSFLSGRLVSMNESEAARAYAAAVEDVTVNNSCT